ncbi:Pyrimidine 5'-nucleotidase YjjG [bacterium HR26]|nr:Pyrimidine 5'-nucleotidase YjjG [bacterium HR26]
MRPGPSPRLVLFDLDDTLCDQATSFRRRVERAVQAALAGERHGDAEAIIQRVVAGALMRTEDLVDVLAEFGLADSWRIERAIQAYISDRFIDLCLFDEAIEVVRAVQQCALTGLVTNGPSQIQREKLRRLGIADLFPIVIISEEVGVAKPDPAIFRLALDRAGVPPSQSAFIGDNPEIDIAGAQAAGLMSIWYNRQGRPWPGGRPPDAEVRTLRELLPLLFPEEAPKRLA